CPPRPYTTLFRSAGRAGGAQADADVAVLGAGVPVGHVRGGLDVPGEDVLDAAVILHRRVEGVDGGTGQTEGLGGPLLLEDLDDGVDCAHTCHLRWPPWVLSRRGAAQCWGVGRPPRPPGAVVSSSACRRVAERCGTGRSGPGRRRRWRGRR